MIERNLRCLVVMVLIVSAVSAQMTLTVPAAPVSPGVPFTVTLIDNGPACGFDLLVTNLLTLMQPTGEVIAPELVGCGPVSICSSSGQPHLLQYTVPASGPGSSGSFVLLCPYASGAAARLDVVAPSAAFPDIHTYPAQMPHGVGAHHIETSFAGNNDWEFANTAAVPRSIAPTIDILAPGGSVPIVSASVTLLVPAGGVVRTTLPLTGLPAGPYTVSVQWFDPGLGAATTVRHGIELSSITSLDLHLPGGKLIPVGGSIPARFAVRDLSSFWTVPTWSYLFCVGILPGSTPLPGGALVPLVPDVVVIASITDGIGGLLTNNVGVTSPQGAYCAHAVTTWATAAGISIAHPNVPGVSGFTAHVAAVAFEPGSQVWAASQPEDVTLQ
jgi:hypothetical protein